MKTLTTGTIITNVKYNNEDEWQSLESLEPSTNYMMTQFKRNHHQVIMPFLEALMHVRILGGWTVGRWNTNHIIKCCAWEEKRDARLP